MEPTGYRHFFYEKDGGRSYLVWRRTDSKGKVHELRWQRGSGGVNVPDLVTVDDDDNEKLILDIITMMHLPEIRYTSYSGDGEFYIRENPDRSELILMKRAGESWQEQSRFSNGVNLPVKEEGNFRYFAKDGIDWRLDDTNHLEISAGAGIWMPLPANPPLSGNLHISYNHLSNQYEIYDPDAKRLILATRHWDVMKVDYDLAIERLEPGEKYEGGLHVLRGETGLGKDELVRAAAHLMNEEVFFVAGNEDMEPMDLIQFQTLTHKKTGHLYTAVNHVQHHGGWVVIDEFNKVPTIAQNALKTSLAQNQHVRFESGKEAGSEVEQHYWNHPRCRILGTMNRRREGITSAKGSEDEATLDRQSVVDFVWRSPPAEKKLQYELAVRQLAKLRPGLSGAELEQEKKAIRDCVDRLVDMAWPMRLSFLGYDADQRRLLVENDFKNWTRLLSSPVFVPKNRAAKDLKRAPSPRVIRNILRHMMAYPKMREHAPWQAFELYFNFHADRIRSKDKDAQMQSIRNQVENRPGGGFKNESNLPPVLLTEQSFRIDGEYLIVTPEKVKRGNQETDYWDEIRIWVPAEVRTNWELPEDIVYWLSAKNPENSRLLYLALQVRAIGGNLICVGEPGSGKSFLAHAVAELLSGPEVELLELSEDTDKEHLTFRPFIRDGVSGYDMGPVARAIALGKTGVIEESLQAKPGVRAVLNEAHERKFLTQADGRILKGPDSFGLIHTLNPPEDDLYVENEFDDTELERSAILQFESLSPQAMFDFTSAVSKRGQVLLNPRFLGQKKTDSHGRVATDSNGEEQWEGLVGFVQALRRLQKAQKGGKKLPRIPGLRPLKKLVKWMRENWERKIAFLDTPEYLQDVFIEVFLKFFLLPEDSRSREWQKMIREALKEAGLYSDARGKDGLADYLDREGMVIQDLPVLREPVTGDEKLDYDLRMIQRNTLEGAARSVERIEEKIRELVLEEAQWSALSFDERLKRLFMLREIWQILDVTIKERCQGTGPFVHEPANRERMEMMRDSLIQAHFFNDNWPETFLTRGEGVVDTDPSGRETLEALLGRWKAEDRTGWGCLDEMLGRLMLNTDNEKYAQELWLEIISLAMEFDFDAAKPAHSYLRQKAVAECIAKAARLLMDRVPGEANREMKEWLGEYEQWLKDHPLEFKAAEATEITRPFENIRADRVEAAVAKAVEGLAARRIVNIEKDLELLEKSYASLLKLAEACPLALADEPSDAGLFTPLFEALAAKMETVRDAQEKIRIYQEARTWRPEDEKYVLTAEDKTAEIGEWMREFEALRAEIDGLLSGIEKSGDLPAPETVGKTADAFEEFIRSHSPFAFGLSGVEIQIKALRGLYSAVLDRVSEKEVFAVTSLDPVFGKILAEIRARENIELPGSSMEWELERVRWELERKQNEAERLTSEAAMAPAEFASDGEEPFKEYKDVQVRSMNAPRLSADHELLATGGDGNNLRVMARDQNGNYQTIQTLRADNPVSDVVFSKDKNLLVFVDTRGNLQILKKDGDNYVKSREFSIQHEKHRLALSEDGKTIVMGTGCNCGRIFIWRAASDGTFAEPQEIEYGSPIYSVSVSGDGSKFVIGSSDYTAKVYSRDSSGTYKRLQTLDHHQAYVRAVALSTDKEMMLTGGDDYKVRVWEVKDDGTYKHLQTIECESKVSGVFLSEDKKKIVTLSNGNIGVWVRGEDGKFKNVQKLYFSNAWSAELSADGESLVAIAEGLLRVWPLNSAIRARREQEVRERTTLIGEAINELKEKQAVIETLIAIEKEISAKQEELAELEKTPSKRGSRAAIAALQASIRSLETERETLLKLNETERRIVEKREEIAGNLPEAEQIEAEEEIGFLEGEAEALRELAAADRKIRELNGEGENLAQAVVAEGETPGSEARQIQIKEEIEQLAVERTVLAEQYQEEAEAREEEIGKRLEMRKKIAGISDEIRGLEEEREQSRGVESLPLREVIEKAGEMFSPDPAQELPRGGTNSGASMTDDGKILATGEKSGETRIWELNEEGQYNLSQTIKQSTEASGVFLSGDGEILATGNNSGLVKVLRRNGGGQYEEIQQWVENRKIWRVFMSEDKEVLITSGEHYKANVYLRGADGTYEFLQALEHGNDIVRISLSKDKSVLVTGSSDHKAKTWIRGEDKKYILDQTLDHHYATVWGVALSEDNQVMVTAGEDQKTRIWTRGNDGKYKHLQTLEHSSVIGYVLLSPDAEILITGDVNGRLEICLRKEDGKYAKLQTISAGMCVWNIVMSRDKQILAAGGDSSSEKIWKLNPEVERKLVEMKKKAVQDPDAEGLRREEEVAALASVREAFEAIAGLDRELFEKSLQKRRLERRIAGGGASRDLRQQAEALESEIERLTAEKSVREAGINVEQESRAQEIAARVELRQKLAGIEGGIREREEEKKTLESLSRLDSGALSELIHPGEDLYANSSDERWEDGYEIRGLCVSKDKSMIVTGNKAGKIKMRKLGKDGKYREEQVLDHGEKINMLALSEDGKLLISVSYDLSSAKVWILKNGSFELFQELKHSNGLAAVTISKDGKALFVGTKYGDIHVWRRESDGEKYSESQKLDCGSGSIRNIALSDDEELLIGGTEEGNSKAWKRSPGGQYEFLQDLPHGGSKPVCNVLIRKDKSVLITGDDRKARLWLKQADGLYKEDTEKRISIGGYVLGLALTDDGGLLATGAGSDTNQSGRIFIREENGGYRLLQELVRGNSVWRTAFSGDGSVLVTTQDDGTVTVWRMNPEIQKRIEAAAKLSGGDAGAELLRIEEEIAAFQADAEALKQIAEFERRIREKTAEKTKLERMLERGAGDAKEIRKQKTALEREIRAIETEKAGFVEQSQAEKKIRDEGIAKRIEFKQRLAGIDAQIREKEEEKEALEKNIRRSQSSLAGLVESGEAVFLKADDENWNDGGGAVRGLCLSEDETLLVTGENNNNVQIRTRGKDGKFSKGQTLDHGGSVEGVFLSADKTRLISLGDNERAKVWVLKKDQCELFQTLEVNGNVWAGALSGDEKTLVLGTKSGKVEVWRKKTDGKYERAQTISARGKIRGIELSPDGKELMLCGQDMNAAIWHLNGEEYEEFQDLDHYGCVSIALSRDLSKLFTGGSESSKVKVWTRQKDGKYSESQTLEHGSWVLGMSLTGDAELLVTVTGSGESKNGRVWIADGDKSYRLLQAFEMGDSTWRGVISEGKGKLFFAHDSGKVTGWNMNPEIVKRLEAARRPPEEFKRELAAVEKELGRLNRERERLLASVASSLGSRPVLPVQEGIFPDTLAFWLEANGILRDERRVAGQPVLLLEDRAERAGAEHENLFLSRTIPDETLLRTLLDLSSGRALPAGSAFVSLPAEEGESGITAGFFIRDDEGKRILVMRRNLFERLAAVPGGMALIGEGLQNAAPVLALLEQMEREAALSGKLAGVLADSALKGKEVAVMDESLLEDSLSINAQIAALVERGVQVVIRLHGDAAQAKRAILESGKIKNYPGQLFFAAANSDISLLESIRLAIGRRVNAGDLVFVGKDALSAEDILQVIYGDSLSKNPLAPVLLYAVDALANRGRYAKFIRGNVFFYSAEALSRDLLAEWQRIIAIARAA